jgi:cyclin-dependent kinase regulatory subunit CKS1
MATAQQMGIDTSRRNRIPRPLTDDERARLDEFIDSIHYSTRSVSLRIQALVLVAPGTDARARYSDNEFEYRHVQLPKAMLKAIPAEYHDKSKGTLKLLWEEEWRGMGITQVRFVTPRVHGSPKLIPSPESRLGTL